MFAQEFLGIVGGIVGIIRQHAQIEAFFDRQRRLVAQHHIQEFQALDMAAQNHKAHGERRGKQKPTGPHSQVQNTAATTTATADRPMLRP